MIRSLSGSVCSGAGVGDAGASDVDRESEGEGDGEGAGEEEEGGEEDEEEDEDEEVAEEVLGTKGNQETGSKAETGQRYSYVRLSQAFLALKERGTRWI